MKDWNWKSYKNFNIVTKRDKVLGVYYEIVVEEIVVRFFNRRDIISFVKFCRMKGKADLKIINLFNGTIVNAIN